MKKILSAIILSVATFAVQADNFTLTSPQLDAHKHMSKSLEFDGFGCSGGNTSPTLKWSGEPEGTKSFALTVYDPDAPTGSGWWHWLMINIPANVHQLEKNSGDPESGKAPKGSRQTKTDYGSVGFGGACPPKGDPAHHYHFKLFALDVDKLALPADASAAMVGYNLNAHALEVAEIVTIYQR